MYIGLTEIQHSDDDRVFEREKHDTDTPGDTEDNEKVYEQEFLDPRVLCEYGRTERTANTGLYQESGRS
jgi:hypothetical protein